MNYIEIRNKIKTGDLYFTYSHGLMTKVIEWVTGSRIVHVGIFVWLDSRLFCAESVLWKGCSIELASERLKDEDIIAGRSPSKLSEEIIKELIFKDIGRIPYDWTGVLASPFWATHSARKYCAEWVDNVTDIVPKIPARGVYPVDIYNIVKRNRAIIKP